MAIYSRAFTVSASSSQEFELEVEGDVITYVRIRFPPGPSGLLRVAVHYGEKRIFPYEADTWFYGDNEIIEWHEYYELPETPCTLKVIAVNDDDTYDHTFYLVLNVQKREHTTASQIATKLAKAFRRLLGWV